MFKNLRIKPRLILCFVLTVCFASISGAIGSVLLLNMDSQYSRALVENGFSQGDIGDFNTYLNKGSAVVRDIIFLTEKEEVEASQKELEEISKKTDEALKELEVNCQTEEEQKYVKILNEKLPLYREKRDKVAELGIAGKNDEALALFHEEARPLLNEAMQAGSDLMALNVQMGDDVSSSLTMKSRIAFFIVLGVIAGAVAVSVVFAVYIAGSFAKPIIEVKDATAKLERGDLNIVLDCDSADEIGEMARSFNKAAETMKVYIKEIERGLSEVSRGNFDVSTSVNFQGDFKEIEDSVNVIIEGLSDAMRHIKQASGQVSIGSSQMAESAQSLAEGATEQAGAVEELQATVNELLSQAQDSAKESEESYGITRKVTEEAKTSSEEMNELIYAMQRINETSGKIQNIIADIEDIAAQTNLLSLNAAIEAARAGEAGKGFAVVADQIRKLASDSAASAVNTRELIENSIREVQNGNNISDHTVKSLKKVMEGMAVISQKSKETKEASLRQAASIRQIDEGINQISGVIQNNSALAQESSATSEELSAQAVSLDELMSQFKLKS